eukprot:gene3873-4831_t
MNNYNLFILFILFYLCILQIECSQSKQITTSSSLFSGHSYQIIPFKGKTWEECQEHAKLQNGYIVQINSESEQNFIQKILLNNVDKNKYWIGANSLDSDRGRLEFSWKDGEENSGLMYSMNGCYGYCNFNEDRDTQNIGYVVMGSGFKWYTISNSDSVDGYILEKEEQDDVEEEEEEKNNDTPIINFQSESKVMRGRSLLLLNIEIKKTMINYLDGKVDLETSDISLYTSMTSKLNGIDIPVTVVNSTFLSIVMPNNSRPGGFFIEDTLSGDSSPSTYLDLKPWLRDSISADPGKQAIVTGRFMTEINLVTIDGMTCTNLVVDPAGNLLTFNTPANGNGIFKTLVAATSSSQSNEIPFYYTPKITNVIQTNTPSITVVGENFAKLSSTSLVFKSITTLHSSTFQFTNETTIVINMYSSLRSTDVSIVSNGAVSNEYYLKLTPYLSTVSTAPSQGGVISLTGLYLNSLNYDFLPKPIVVTVGSNICASAKNPAAKPSTIECIVGPGTGVNFTVSVSIDGQPSAKNVLFSYEPPQITGLQQETTSVIINGKNFGAVSSDITVSLNGGPNISNCQILTQHTQVKCPLQETDYNGPLHLFASGIDSGASQLNLLPYLTASSPASSIGGMVTISGYFLSKGTEYSGKIGTVNCNSLAVVDSGESKVVCDVPPNTEASNSEQAPLFSIIKDNLPSLNQVTYVYSEPAIVNIVQDHLTLVITGNTFGTQSNLPTIQLNQQTLPCQLVLIQSQLNCTITSSFYKGDLIVSNYNGFSTQFLKLKPMINNLISSNTNGGTVSLYVDLVNDLYMTGIYQSMAIEIDNGLFKFSDISIHNTSNNNYISFESVEGIQPNSQLVFILDGSSSYPFTFNYLPPKVLSYSQTSPFELSLVGESFGINETVSLSIYGTNNGNINCKVITKHTNILCDFTNDAETVRNTGSNLVTRGQFTSEPFNLRFTPTLVSVTGRALIKGGGAVTLVGDLLNLKDINDQPLPSYIRVNGQDVIPSNVQSIGVGKLEVVVPAGSHGSKNQISLSIDGKMSNQVEFSVDLPTVGQVISNNLFYKGNGGMVTIQGTNFIKQIELTRVNIGPSQCTQLKYIDGETLECFFDASVEPDPKGILVTVDCDGLIGSAYSFLYNEDDPCPNKCSNHGTCNSGTCICDTGYTQPDCSVKTSDNSTKPLPPDTQNPNNATFLNNFQVLFTHIREITPSGEVVFIQPISVVNWTTISNTTTSINTLGEINGTDFKLYVESTLYEQQETIHFAGETIQMDPNSLKYQIKLTGWKVQQSINLLEIIYVLSNPSFEQDQCSKQVENQVTYDNNSDLRWITIQLNNKTFVSKFSKRVIIDSRTMVSKTVLLQSGDSIFKDPYFVEKNITTTGPINDNSNSSVVLVALQIPSFQESAIIDPNFSMLLNFKQGDDNECKKEKSSLWWISLVAVGGVVGVGASTAGILLYKKKAKTKEFKNKLSQLNKQN